MKIADGKDNLVCLRMEASIWMLDLHQNASSQMFCDQILPECQIHAALSNLHRTRHVEFTPDWGFMSDDNELVPLQPWICDGFAKALRWHCQCTAMATEVQKLVMVIIVGVGGN